MRKFNYDDNEEYREEVDKFFNENDSEISDEEYEILLDEEQTMQELQLKVVYRELNHQILRTAMRMCEKSFWWKFYSQKTKLNYIDRAYKRLKKLEEE